MMKYLYISILFILWVYIGVGCEKFPNKKTIVTIQRTVDGDAYFQPEDTSGYYTLPTSSGKCTLELDLEHPTYYRFVGHNFKFYTVYLVPGTQMKIIETKDSISFQGDYAKENQFIQNHKYHSSMGDYSVNLLEKQKEDQKILNNLIAELKSFDLAPDFIHQHELYYRFDYYRNLLHIERILTLKNEFPSVPKGIYLSLKECIFEDPLILNLPNWFSIMNDIFLKMEQEGWLKVDPEKFAQVYAKKIHHPKLRSLFLVKLLDLMLLKGYWNNFDIYLENVRPMITDPEALAKLPKLEKKYIEAKANNQSIAQGTMAPDFKAYDKNGKIYTLADFKGKVIVLDFWFTGCIPCRQAMPKLEKLAEKMKNNPICFISVSLDYGDKMIALWKKMISNREGEVLHLNIPEGFKADIVKTYGIRGVPRVVIIDKEGRVVNTCAFSPSDPKLRVQLKQLIKL